ncbi:MAG: arginyltransferase [Candidatus Sedimenticola endophacoides]
MTGQTLPLYITPEHPCSYLPGRRARTLFLPEGFALDTAIYQSLIDLGFRRSGDMLYRPECDTCHGCHSTRLPVERFRPRRSQRRVAAAAGDRLQSHILPPEFNPKHFALYKRYLEQRHPDGEMTKADRERYLQFFTSAWCETRFVELRLDQRLVAVVDLLPQGLSAVYTFFEPDLAHMSPGVLTILWQIEHCQDEGLPWLYLGYWIPGCEKMSYKSDYRPLQLLEHGMWVEHGRRPQRHRGS